MLTQKVVAAVDFGTHGSGYAWSVISAQNQDAQRRLIKVRTQWPAQPVSSAKNLTALLVDSQGEVIAWGYEAKRITTTSANPGYYVDSFKMKLIDAEVGTSVGGDDELAGPKLVELFLHKIYRLAVDDIAMSGYREEEIRWCLTVPAIWDDYQKQVMWKAAVAAGFPDDEKRLLFAIEPEAAAHYARVAGVRTLGATGGRRANLMSAGSRFVVADCGGGTIDVTAYRSDAGGKLSEVGRDFGGAFGSEYLNKAFLDIAAEKLGGYSTLAQLASAKSSAFMDFLANWERAKLTVHLDPHDDIYISIPTALDRLLSHEVRSKLATEQEGIDDHLILPPTDLTRIFESVVPQVFHLIDRQIAEIQHSGRRSTGELVILVGGFGASPYLQESLVRHLQGRADVLLPPEPAVAVLYGAAHFAYDPQTRARRSKYTYGCESAMAFRNGIDPPEKRRVLKRDGSIRCDDRFSRFVAAGQAIGSDEAITHVFYPLEDNQAGIDFKFFRSRKNYPQYTDEPGVDFIGTLRVDYGNMKSLPVDKKGVKVTMFFGDTRIRTRAALIGTGESVEVELEFESRIGR
jgi:molecular chaperone DnaK (HSP70)